MLYITIKSDSICLCVHSKYTEVYSEQKMQHCHIFQLFTCDIIYDKIIINNRVDINNTIDAIILGQVAIATLFAIVCVIKFIFKTIRVLHLRFLIRKRLYDFDTEPRYSKSGIILNLRERLGDVVVSSKYISAIDAIKLEDIERRYCFRFKASDDPECEIFKKI